MYAVQLKCIVFTRRMVADPHLALRAYDRHRAFMTLACGYNLFVWHTPLRAPTACTRILIYCNHLTINT